MVCVKDNQTSFIETNGQFAHIIQEFNRYSVDDVAVKTEVPRGTIRIPAKLDLTQVPAADASGELVGYFPSTCCYSHRCPLLALGTYRIVAKFEGK